MESTDATSGRDGKKPLTLALARQLFATYRDLSFVARMGLPARVPAGFHSEWVTADMIRAGREL